MVLKAYISKKSHTYTLTKLSKLYVSAQSWRTSSGSEDEIYDDIIFKNITSIYECSEKKISVIPNN